MATFPEEKKEATPDLQEEAVIEEVPEEIVQGFIDEVQTELDELSRQIQRARLAEQFFRSKVKLGGAEEKATLSQLASVQTRAHELAGRYNQQADFVDYLKSRLDK